MKILLTGSRGRLGVELKKHLGVIDFIGDITLPIKKEECELVIHSAAYTDVTGAEQDSEKCFHTNVYGTSNITNTYIDTPFVYISSEYAKNPLGIYALTKYLGEEVIKTHPHHLIIRTLFKPNPFPFDKAYTNQYTQGDYVDVIAKLIADMIKEWNKKSDLVYIGTGRKTMFELAKRTRPDVVPDQITNPIIPKDYL